jgi:predicted amidohydrolase
MASETLRVAIGQFAVSDSDYASNMRKIKDMVEEMSLSSSERPDVALFPELAVEGYAFTERQWDTRPSQRAVMDFYSSLARDHDMHIISGFSEQDGDNWFDSSGCFAPSGYVGISRKAHLWGNEAKFFSPGECSAYINVKGWKIALQICADIGFPELARRQTLAGAELIAVIGAWASPFGYMWRNCCFARATENLLGLAASNRLGQSTDGGVFCGESMAVNERGVCIGNLGGCDGWFTASFSKKDMNEWRKTIPWLNMRRTDIY